MLAKKDQLLERFDLDPTKKGRTYSKGNRQKVALVAALASDVELLILDEPTAGLDPLMEAEFRMCIEEDRRKGSNGLAGEPHPGRGGGPVRSDQHRASRAEWSKAGPWPSCAISRGPPSRPRSSKIPSGLNGLAGVHNVVIRDHKFDLEVDSDQIGPGSVPGRRAGRAKPRKPASDSRRAIHAPLPGGRSR